MLSFYRKFCMVYTYRCRYRAVARRRRSGWSGQGHSTFSTSLRGVVRRAPHFRTVIIIIPRTRTMQNAWDLSYLAL